MPLSPPSLPLPRARQLPPHSSALASSLMRVRHASQLSPSASRNAVLPSSNQLPITHGMENSKLPIDICELVIDSMALDWNPYSDPPCFLLACALTCKAWTPRSLYALYSTVYLDAKSVAKFIECLVEFPARAAWVRELYLDDDDYIPIGMLFSSGLLVNWW
ncbi:hypothetical protein GY45DRAFT_864100 [Cubamyces sp. BRFM 1775]|nr:hypothetical protein GY45DRAFT_864100 [Cubamyces sp. BRFM 1775]